MWVRCEECEVDDSDDAGLAWIEEYGYCPECGALLKAE